jgi:hypothetical protein
MTGGRRRGRRRHLGVLVTTLAGASVLAAGTAGAGLADPSPVPHGRAVRSGPATAGRGHLQGRHSGTGRKGRHQRPRTVVRCQSDDTDQVDEIDDDTEEPRHHVVPGGTVAPSGSCSGVGEALGIADILAGDRPRGPRVR